MGIQSIDTLNMVSIESKPHQTSSNKGINGLFSRIFQGEISKESDKPPLKSADNDFKDFMLMLESIAGTLGLSMGNMLTKLETGTLDTSQANLLQTEKQMLTQLNNCFSKIQTFNADKQTVINLTLSDTQKGFLQVVDEAFKDKLEVVNLSTQGSSESFGDKDFKNIEKIVKLFTEFQKSNDNSNKLRIMNDIPPPKWDLTPKPRTLEQSEANTKNDLNTLNVNPLNYSGKIIRTEKSSLTSSDRQEKQDNFNAFTQNTQPTLTNSVFGLNSLSDIDTQTAVYKGIENSIIDGLKIIYSDNKKEMTLSLNPENLGKMMLKITSEVGGITAHITVDNQQTQELINQQLSVLTNSLKEQGLNFKAVEVYYSDQLSGDRSQSQQFGQNSRQGQPKEQGFAHHGQTNDKIDTPIVSMDRIIQGSYEYLA